MNNTKSDHTLAGETRDKSGKGVARALRLRGFVPAVVYGAGKPAQPVAVKLYDVNMAMRDGNFFTRPQTLSLGKESVQVLPKSVQRDVVDEKIIHVDFLRFQADKEVHVNVSVEITGEDKCPGIKAGGVLQLVESEIELVCRADSIPEHVEISIATLDIGDSIHLVDVKFPKGVRPAITDHDVTICSIISTRASEVEEDLTAAPVPAEVELSVKKGKKEEEGAEPAKGGAAPAKAAPAAAKPAEKKK